MDKTDWEQKREGRLFPSFPRSSGVFGRSVRRGVAIETGAGKGGKAGKCFQSEAAARERSHRPLVIDHWSLAIGYWPLEEASR